MVGGDISGSSRRCNECKTKRKKCDLAEPVCMRCQRSGTRCTGPSRPNIFVNHHKDSFPLETSRAALKKAYSRRPTDTGRSRSLHELSTSRLRHLRTAWVYHQLKSTLPSDQNLLSCRRVHLEPVYTALQDEFRPGKTNHGGIFSADRAPLMEVKHYSAIATCIRSLLPWAGQGIKALDSSIFSLLSMYYGRLHGDPGLADMSRGAYISALNQFHRHLDGYLSGATKHPRLHQILIRVSVALQFYEQMANMDVHDDGHRAHIDGALELLASVGPGLMQNSQDLRLAVSSLKPAATFLAISRRKPIILSEPAWRNQDPDSVHSFRENLFDLGLKLPSLLSNADNLALRLQNHDLEAENLVDLSLHLLLNFDELWNDMDGWMHALEIHSAGPLYWPGSQPVVLVAPNTDTECTPKQVSNFHQLSFMYGTIAGLLIQQWAFRLEILMTMIDLQQAILSRSKSRYVRKITFANMTRHNAVADETSQLICEAQIYLDSCFEGFLCAQLPSRTVERYFQRKNA